MGLPSSEQFIEFFRQVAIGNINSEALQELIENGVKIGFRRLASMMWDAARKAAEMIADVYWKSQAYKAIAEDRGLARFWETAKRDF